MLAELARRSGVTPLTERSEFVEAFLSRAGVPALDGDLTEEELDSGLRMALLGRRGELSEG